MGWTLRRATTVARGLYVAALGCAGAGCIATGPTTVIRGSHPSRLAGLETPATVPQGSVGLSGSAGGEFAHYGGVDSRDMRSTKVGGGGRVRIGILDGLEGSVEGSAVKWRTSAPICKRDPLGHGLDTIHGMGRGGFKWSPKATRRFFALTTGMGGGRGPMGTYLAPDIGLSLGVEGGPVVPFVHVEVVGSFPMAGRPIEALHCLTSEHRAVFDYEPADNVLGRGTFGFKVPLPEVRGARLNTLVNLYFAGTINVSPWISGGLVGGIEVVLGRRSATIER